jgi:hypothetical protein
MGQACGVQKNLQALCSTSQHWQEAMKNMAE